VVEEDGTVDWFNREFPSAAQLQNDHFANSVKTDEIAFGEFTQRIDCVRFGPTPFNNARFDDNCGTLGVPLVATGSLVGQIRESRL
jgi:hypothetical protein